MPVWLAALLPMVGVILGASLQYWLGRASERERQSRTLRSQAYADYLRASAMIATAQKHDSPEDYCNGIALMTDAKLRIAIYGSSFIVEALGRFADNEDLSQPDGVSSYVSLCQKMRNESLPRECASEKSILRLIYGQGAGRDA